ncbi:MAG: mechanosensitive ion channel [Chlorobiaceae bacterium]|nr:mechanosensitive ion channel [Chlorobiaceae bacterium]
MEKVVTFWSYLQATFLIPAVIVLATIFFYVGANALFKGVIKVIRSSIKEINVQYELMIWPFRLLVSLIALPLLLYYVPLTAVTRDVLHHTLLIISITGITWFMMRLFLLFEQFILPRYTLKVRENEAARRIATHISLARKIMNVILVLVAISGILMSFDTVRQVGLSILASAGIAGVILGFAAQKSLSTLIAGIQIAITQPISIDDVVVVENERGRIEEITLTYVVVQLWDQRRLIVPISWFIDRPFQNWSRTSSELLGTVFLYMDYTIQPETLRQELERIVSSTPLWDKRVVKMHVTNTSENSVEMRALVSAANTPELWELRCLVREQLIEFIQRNYPGWLPKVTMEMEQMRVADKE